MVLLVYFTLEPSYERQLGISTFRGWVLKKDGQNVQNGWKMILYENNNNKVAMQPSNFLTRSSGVGASVVEIFEWQEA